MKKKHERKEEFKSDPALEYILLSIKTRTTRVADLNSSIQLDSFIGDRQPTARGNLGANIHKTQAEVKVQEAIIMLLCEVAERLRKYPPK